MASERDPFIVLYELFSSSVFACPLRNQPLVEASSIAIARSHTPIASRARLRRRRPSRAAPSRSTRRAHPSHRTEHVAVRAHVRLRRAPARRYGGSSSSINKMQMKAKQAEKLEEESGEAPPARWSRVDLLVALMAAVAAEREPRRHRLSRHAACESLTERHRPRPTRADCTSLVPCKRRQVALKKALSHIRSQTPS